jgi:peptidyl-prolyl cis-trans isomerase D
MSLIERMRNSTESPLTRLIIFLVGVIFVVAGGGSVGRGCAGGMAATVNGETVPLAEYERALANTVQRAGGGLTDERRSQLRTAVLDQLVLQHLVLQEAEAMGLAVSDQELARALKAEKAFQKEGVFDAATYDQIVARMGLSRAEFEHQQRQQLLIEKVQDLATRGVLVTDAEVRAGWVEENTKLDVTYVRLPPANFIDDIVVSDADRDAWIAAHGADIDTRYKSDFERSYNLPRRFHLHTILLRTDLPGADKEAVKAHAEAVAAEAKAGADFATLARRWSEDLSVKDGGDLGVAPADAIDPVIVAAAEAAGAGGVSGAVETGRGFQVVRVESIEEARVVPIEEARPGIAVTMIREDRVAAEVQAYGASVVKAWQATGAVPRDLTEARSLVVDTTGPFSLADEGVPNIGDGPAVTGLLSTLRAAKAGDVLALPVEVKGMYYVLAVTSRTEPDESTYARDAVAVRSRLELFAKQAFVKAWVAQLRKSARVQLYLGT